MLSHLTRESNPIVVVLAVDSSRLVRPRWVEAGRHRHHLVSMRTKCWHTRPSGLKRQRCANCVTRVKWYQGERWKQWVQGELTGAEGRSEKDEKMEVGEEVDSKKKLDQRKKELVVQLRRIDEFQDMSQKVGDVPEEK